MRKATAAMMPGTPRQAYRVVSLERLSATWKQDINFAVVVSERSDIEIVENLVKTGLRNVSWVRSDELEYDDIIFAVLGKDVVG